MRSYLAAFVEALLLCIALTPIARRWALRVGAVSATGGRNLNQLEIPRLGGIAIALSALAPSLTLLFVDSGVALFIRQRQDLVLGLLLGGSLMCFTGALDDVRGLRARTKFTMQLAAALLAYFMGFRIDGLMVPFLGPIALGYAGLPLTLVWIVGITNAVNLIDGLDGLAAGVVFFAATSNLVVALMSGNHTETVFVALLMVSLMGALLGFLFFNFNPARIFMGDSGSYFLGFVLATSSIMAPLQKASTAVSLLVPIVALGLPIFDTLFSMLRRYLARRPMFSADRGHIHHRLLDMGITHRRAVITLYLASIIFAGSAIAIALGRDWEIGLGLLGASIVIVGLIRAVGFREFVRRQEQKRDGDAQAEKLRLAVPHLLLSLDRATTIDDIVNLLDEVKRALDVPELRLLTGDVAPGSFAPPSRHTARFDTPNGDTSLLIGAHRPLELSPQTSILLQLVADQIAQRLARAAAASGAGEAGAPSLSTGTIDDAGKHLG